ncbi:Na(+)-translocating NADH-quinone reductase subunit C [Ferrimonas pelagia]|uniref:Na(+)-translocating NADH-quinone reductase subunit C n=1 Tax=Ferrimonas pelagia TaxID=1177826 RepID=A0ABP9EDL5_9GAMM
MRYNKDSVVGTMLFTLVLCLFCSVMITGTSAGLKERAQAKQLAELKRSVLKTAGYGQLIDNNLSENFDSHVTAVVLDLDSGAIQPDLDAMTFDDRMAAMNPDTSRKPKKDTARIGRRADMARAFKITNDQGELEGVVMPIHGKGLWSVIYGYVALDADLNTIKNVTIYEHGETPGIADFLEDESWLSQWQGKKLFDDSGKVAVKVVRGGAEDGDEHAVDGVSGATLTGRGVERSMQFWFGEEGFRAFLSSIKASEV